METKQMGHYHNVMRFIIFCLFALVSLAASAQTPSPNLTGSIARLDLANYQLLSGKGAANGYAGLDASSMIVPTFIFPDFAAAADGTIWVKSGVTLAPQNSSTSDSTGITAIGVHIGQITGSTWGVSQQTVARALVLRGGTSNNIVYIYNGQTLGGANSGHNGFTWSIGPAGIFSLGSGQLSGNLDLNSNDITEADSIAGSGANALTVNLTTSLITGAVDLTLAGGTGGVIVPNTTSSTAAARALNRASADLLYGDLAGTNTWIGVQTFTEQPVFTVPLSISQTTGLQAALDAKLPKAGGTMTGAIEMGSSKITGLGTPTSAQDATTKTYVDGLTVTSTGGILTDLTVSGGGLSKSMTSNVTTIELLSATTARSGYLTSADWNTFNGKMSTLSATLPLVLTGSTLSIPAATGSVNGHLTSTDWATFNGKAPLASPAFTGTVTMANPLGVTYGGTGLNLSATVADRFIYTSSTGVFTTGTITAAGRAIIDDASISDQRTTLGIVIDRNVLTTTGLTGLVGGTAKLDGVDVSGYTEGDELTFKIADIHYRYRLADSGLLPTEVSPTYIIPDTPSGTKFWALVDSRDDSEDSADLTLNVPGGIAVSGAINSVGPIETDGYVYANETVTAVGNIITNGTFIATPEAKSGAGPLSVSTLTTRWTTTAADAGTLANGTNGQLKIVTMVVDGGDGTLTPATKTGFTSVTFDAVGDSLTLQYHTTFGWMIVSHYGCTVNP
jgi:hypothetical protein